MPYIRKRPPLDKPTKRALHQLIRMPTLPQYMRDGAAILLLRQYVREKKEAQRALCRRRPESDD